MGIDIEKRVKNFDDSSYLEIYHKKGDITYYHREDGPAHIKYSKDGLIIFEAYWVNNKLHREDGPAFASSLLFSSIEIEEYRINGKRLSKEEWEKDYGWKLRIKDTPMGEIFK